MAGSYAYHNFRVDFVYGDTTGDQKHRIIDFWQRHRVLGDSQAAAQRVDEVVFLLVDEHERVIGIRTVYIDRNPRDHQQYFYYRTFIQPENLDTMLMKSLLAKTYQYFRELPMADKPAGLVTVIENPKLTRKGVRCRFQ